jgi:hypothetical protein
MIPESCRGLLANRPPSSPSSGQTEQGQPKGRRRLWWPWAPALRAARSSIEAQNRKRRSRRTRWGFTSGGGRRQRPIFEGQRRRRELGPTGGGGGVCGSGAQGGGVGLQGAGRRAQEATASYLWGARAKEAAPSWSPGLAHHGHGAGPGWALAGLAAGAERTGLGGWTGQDVGRLESFDG